VAVVRAQPRAAPGTIIKELAGVDRHRFASREAAARTGDYGIENDVFHALWAAFTIGTGPGNALYENREQ
jgi:hypothetical protein